jgi:hypothetical protein
MSSTNMNNGTGNASGRGNGPGVNNEALAQLVSREVQKALANTRGQPSQQQPQRQAVSATKAVSDSSGRGVAKVVLSMVFLYLIFIGFTLLLFFVTRDGYKHFHGIKGSEDDTPWKALNNRMHYLLSVFTTTGGGITAKSHTARLITNFMMITVVATWVLLLTALL